MGTLTTQNSLYKPANSETGWGTLVDANWDTLDRPELLNIAASALHVAATLGDLLDEIYRETRRLGTTRTFDVTDSGGNFVVSAGRSVIVRR